MSWTEHVAITNQLNSVGLKFLYVQAQVSWALLYPSLVEKRARSLF